MIRLLPLLLLAACAGDETISGYADPAARYRLLEMDGNPAGPAVTIAFPEEGKITGAGPCNSYGARQTVPYPWISVEDLFSTERACPDLAFEARYLDRLRGVSLAEASDNTLILSDEDGPVLVYQRLPE
ncbi:MAG: META domain-containing protein [Rhodobacteraceae bacterium]|nr:META domain-containing protein [Paracoccaceae bacterium]